MKSGKLGFGIVGCGLISKFHATAIKELQKAELVGVFDNYRTNAVRFAEEFPCKVFDTYEDMLKCEDIDIITICTPSGLHAPLAIEAANAKKHIVVEKPMSITNQQISEVIKACEENNVKTCVISQLRFSKAVRFLKKVVDEGVLGKILIGDLNMKYYRSPEYFATSSWKGTWKMDGGGALMNQGIHGIDMLLYLMGPVKNVYGSVKTMVHDIETEDTAIASVEYESGAMGTIHATTSVSPGYPRTIEINGTNGTVVLQEDSILKWDVPDYEIPSELLWSEQKKNRSFHDPGKISTLNHKLQLDDMINAIQEDREPMITIYDGKKPVELILSIYESSKNGKKISLM